MDVICSNRNNKRNNNKSNKENNKISRFNTNK